MGLMFNPVPTRSMPRYGSVLVHAGGGPHGEGLIRDAAFIANAFGASLIGVSTPCTGAADLSATQQEAADVLIEAAGEQFRAATSQVHAGALWRRALAEPWTALSALAWAADLLILDLAEATGGRELTDLMTCTGRAVLVRTRCSRRMALRRALIVWDASAACRRAVAAAMPLLGRVGEIMVLPTSIGASRDAAKALDELEQGLALRNLPVQISHGRSMDPAESLEDQTLRLEPDVLVMSARSRFGRRSPYALLERHNTYAMLSL